MLILSQDKKNICNADRVNHIYVHHIGSKRDWSVIVENYNPDEVRCPYSLGDYKLESKAKEVLERLYNNWGNVDRFEMPEDDAI